MSRQRSVTVEPGRNVPPPTLTRGRRVSPAPDGSSTNALRHTLLRESPGTAVRSVQATPSALMKDCPERARGEMSSDGRSTGTGLVQPGVVTRTATTNERPAATFAGRAREIVW